MLKQRQYLKEDGVAAVEELILNQQARLAKAIEEKQDLLDNFERRYWQWQEVQQMHRKLYSPVRKRGWQPLPEFITKKKAVINIKNSDEWCFGYALLYFLERANLPKKHCDRVCLY